MRKKNLLLILATGLIFGMFSAAAGAVGYEFDKKDGNLLVYTVNKVEGKNTVNSESNDTINLSLSVGETGINGVQRFVFEVSEDILKAYGIAPAEDAQARWLGAGSASNELLNGECDYSFKVDFKKGADAVAVKAFKAKAMIDPINGKQVQPIVVEFVANTVEKETLIEGTLKIIDISMRKSKTQIIPISGKVYKENEILLELKDGEDIASQTTKDKNDEASASYSKCCSI